MGDRRDRPVDEGAPTIRRVKRLKTVGDLVDLRS